jgi:predicted transcriptional regulator
MTTTELETRVVALEAEVAQLRQALEQSRITARINRGLDQADRGEVLPAREALESLRKKYNLQPQ